MVEKSNNFVFEYDLIHHSSLGKGFKIINFFHCLHIVLVIGKHTDVFTREFFLMEGVGGLPEKIHGKIFPLRNFSFWKIIFHGFPSIIQKTIRNIKEPVFRLKVRSNIKT